MSLGSYRTDEDLEDEDLEDYFTPESGNVAFASAYDGWAFRAHQFAGLHAAKMGLKPEKLLPILWGDWGYDARTKRAVKIKANTPSKFTPLFIQVSRESQAHLVRASFNRTLSKKAVP